MLVGINWNLHVCGIQHMSRSVNLVTCRCQKGVFKKGQNEESLPTIPLVNLYWGYSVCHPQLVYIKNLIAIGYIFCV